MKRAFFVRGESEGAWESLVRRVVRRRQAGFSAAAHSETFGIPFAHKNPKTDLASLPY
jgi:hypothetical protein